MKTRMMIGIAVAALLLCTESVQAQSRVVQREPERRDQRLIQKEDPRRSRILKEKPVIKPVRPPKPVDVEVIRSFKRESFDSNRLRMADMIFSTGGLMTTTQIRDITLIFDFDSNRIKFLKKAYLNCIDRANFYKVLSALEFSSSREKIIDYVMDCRRDELRNGDGYYRVSQSDMNDIIKALKGMSFDSTRKKMGSMIVYGTLFTSRQIADMAKTFEFESNRYDFLVKAIDNCVDLQNYYQAVNTLRYSSDRNKLMKAVANNAR